MNLHDAAERLGVHSQTAYAWVRAGELEARRTPSGYEISEATLERFESGGQSARLSPPPLRLSDWDERSRQLYFLLRAGDEPAARRAVDRLVDRGVEVLMLCENLFTPVLHQLGEEWASGLLSVAEEHRASAICERLVLRIEVEQTGVARGVCVVATPSGEQHALPASMAALVLRADRWHVHHLSTQVPTHDLATLARSEASDHVVLSASRSGTVAVAKLAAAIIESSTGRPVHVGAPGATLRQLLALADRSGP